ncbi:MAG: hypothetical protein GFH27_549303n149 [Chloroflexi bacterium AL-W]|nr:hypothetical protein [Chloroflexi bacterium AL-N1]NOK68034.1 hypothetical protein [Chloroflexi bacterium AL-N10]NOK73374.1 hypothetical protein [Chloroflexi bacterium AL-N5]NOK83288.1 hypothetical protein [Chloroflexi bacterium AL-W]NOK87705.1 hypothetical protein [Chloroflexi bacterium AL-N15]
MESLEINWPLLFTQLLNFGLLFGWILLTVLALFHMRKNPLSDKIATALWAAIIVLVPLLGAVAFFIVRPNRELVHSQK